MRGSPALVLPKLKEDGGEGDDGSEELAGKFDARVISGHGDLGHGEGLIAEEVFPEAGAGGIHFREAGQNGEGKVPDGKLLEVDDDEGDGDNSVEEEPEGGIDRGGVIVDFWVDVVSLNVGEEDEEGGEGVVEDFHRSRIDC